MTKTPNFKQNKNFADFLKKKNVPLSETGWNYVGPSEEHGINFLTEWDNSDTTTIPASWHLSENGEVRLRGKVTGGDSNSIIFTLPEETRPEFTERYIIPIEDDVHLENIRFRAFLDGKDVPEDIPVFLAGGIGGDAENSSAIINSLDGVKWTVSHSPWDFIDSGRRGGYVEVFGKSPALYVASGTGPNDFSTSPYKRILTSGDLSNWFEQSTPWDNIRTPNYFTHTISYGYPIATAIAYAEAWNTFYVVGSGSTAGDGSGDFYNGQIKSTNGITWGNDTTNPFGPDSNNSSNWYIFYVPSLGRLYSAGFAGLDGSSTFMYYTEDGITWTPSVTPLDDPDAWGVGRHAINPNTGRIFFVVVSFTDTFRVHIIYSDDGDTWIESGFTPLSEFSEFSLDFSYPIAYANDLHTVAIAGQAENRHINDTIIYASTDEGDTWNPVLTNADLGYDFDIEIQDMTASSNRFIAVAYRSNTAMITSIDGTTWTESSTPWDSTSGTFQTVIYL